MMNVDRDERDMAERLFGMLCDRTVGCEVSGDFTLPDGQPEIRRLLAVNERVLPPAKYVSSSGVECNGTVDYSVLYVGTDGGLLVSCGCGFGFGSTIWGIGQICGDDWRTCGDIGGIMNGC